MRDQLLSDVNKASIFIVDFRTLVGACPVGASSRVFEIAGNCWDPSAKSYIMVLGFYSTKFKALKNFDEN